MRGDRESVEYDPTETLPLEGAPGRCRESQGGSQSQSQSQSEGRPGAQGLLPQELLGKAPRLFPAGELVQTECELT